MGWSKKLTTSSRSRWWTGTSWAIGTSLTTGLTLHQKPPNKKERLLKLDAARLAQTKAAGPAETEAAGPAETEAARPTEPESQGY